MRDHAMRRVFVDGVALDAEERGCLVEVTVVIAGQWG